MKRKRFQNKLSINKATIANLGTPEMESAKGGILLTIDDTLCGWCPTDTGDNFPCSGDYLCRW